MPAPVGGNEGWSAWELLVTTLSGGGLGTAIGAIFWFGRKHGQNEEVTKGLRKDLDSHIAADNGMFAELKNTITDNASKQDQRHEENIKAIGKLPDREDMHDLRDQLIRRLETIEGVARARAPN